MRQILKQPQKFKTEFVKNVITLDIRQDKKGDLFYYVEYSFDGERHGHRFAKMESALDFINSNFR